MLPAEQRVRRRDDFTATVQHGRRTRVPGLVVHVRTSDAAHPPRAGFIVSRAVGTAVVRNRLRRRLRHLLAPHLADSPDGTEIVVRVLPGAATMSRAELAAAVGSALQRVAEPGAT